MSSMGMTIQEVQALLDHNDPSTTLTYYANVKAEKLKEKIDKLQLLSADKIWLKKARKERCFRAKNTRNFRGVAQPG